MDPDSIIAESDENNNRAARTIRVDCIGIPLRANWNLVSFNVVPTDSSVDSVVAPIRDHLLIVRGFDLFGISHGQGADGGLTYNPHLPPEFSTLKWMGHKYGYWVKVDTPCTLRISGEPALCNSPLILNGAWNLIGYLPEEIHHVATALDSNLGGYFIHSQDWTGSYRLVRGFDPLGVEHGQGADGGLTFDPILPEPFSTLIFMMPGFGYWVKIFADSTDTTLYYPCRAENPPMFRGSSQGETFKDTSFSFIPTSRWVDFYGMADLNGEPVEVGDKVTVYDPDGIQCGGMYVHSEGWYGLLPVYRDDETTLDIDEGAEIGDPLTFFINGQMSYSTGGVEPEWIGDGEMVRIDLFVSYVSSELQHTRTLPDKYELAQNYPNPFNPTTHISFTLPHEARRTEDGERDPIHTTLKIYNLLGQVVRTLVDEVREPGYYSVSWDGRDQLGREVTSGVYFYRIEAGEFSETKRMLLVK